MAYYEEEKIFGPVFRTALSLMQTRGHDRYCLLIQQAEVNVVNTDIDSWNGGTYAAGGERIQNVDTHYKSLHSSIFQDVSVLISNTTINLMDYGIGMEGGQIVVDTELGI